MTGTARLAGSIAISAMQALSQEPGYVGAVTCGGCHPQQYESQSASGHAQTLHRSAEHPLAVDFVPMRPLRLGSRYRFAYTFGEGGFAVTTDDGEYALDLPLEWAFGAGAHGVTFVGQSDERHYLEHTFSFYSKARGLAITTGHEASQPETLHQAAGMAYRAESDGIGRCFACHSTGGVFFGAGGEVRVGEVGVRCEACHGPGANHISAIAAANGAGGPLAINNPGLWSPSQLNEFCGDCHRRPKTPSTNFDYAAAWNVRHQPPYLARSGCFEGSVDLSCLTCHDPHENIRQGDTPYYRSKCLACHLGGAQEPAASCGPVEQADCVECHMPAVAVGGHLGFRNHWIGVYADSDKTIPARRP